MNDRYSAGSIINRYEKREYDLVNANSAKDDRILKIIDSIDLNNKKEAELKLLEIKQVIQRGF